MLCYGHSVILLDKFQKYYHTNVWPFQYHGFSTSVHLFFSFSCNICYFRWHSHYPISFKIVQYKKCGTGGCVARVILGCSTLHIHYLLLCSTTLSLTQNDVLLLAHLPTFGFNHSSSTCLLLCSTTLSLTQNDVLLMAHLHTFGFIPLSSTCLLHCSTTLSLTQIDVLLMAHLHNFGFILLNIICFLHYSAIDDMIYTLFDFSDQYILHTSGLTHALADF